MGKSDPIILPVIAKQVARFSPVAILGAVRDDFNLGNDVDLYDIQLGNWNINSDWSLKRKYKSIISTRCPHFAKDPKDFINRCAQHLEPGGGLCVTWELGDHYRFDTYKVGWVKNGEHEFAYAPDNFLWSTIWSRSFESNPVCADFAKMVKKFGYTDLNKAIFEEVPSVLDPSELFTLFMNVSISFVRMWEDRPQLYIIVSAQRRVGNVTLVDVELSNTTDSLTSVVMTS